MIAADWKHGIFPMKRRSRPRYSVTSRDASMAGGVAGVEGGGDAVKLFPFRAHFGRLPREAGVRVRVGVLLLLRSPVAPEEVRFAL